MCKLYSSSEGMTCVGRKGKINSARHSPKPFLSWKRLYNLCNVGHETRTDKAAKFSRAPCRTVSLQQTWQCRGGRPGHSHCGCSGLKKKKIHHRLTFRQADVLKNKCIVVFCVSFFLKKIVTLRTTTIHYGQYILGFHSIGLTLSQEQHKIHYHKLYI